MRAGLTITHHERIGQALVLLREGLWPGAAARYCNAARDVGSGRSRQAEFVDRLIVDVQTVVHGCVTR